MGLLERFTIGFGMVRRSGRVLGSHPKLLVFPLVGGLSGIAFIATLFGSLFLAGSLLEDPGPALYGALFVAYLVETFVASFFSAALVSATRTAFEGETPAIRAAMATAWNRKGPLVAWSVVAALVGVVLRAIESSDNLVARLLAGLFAVAWGVMTYFVVPVIVFRNPSVREMFSESAATFKHTWGESLGAMGTISAVTFLLGIPGVVLGAFTFIAVPSGGGGRVLAAVLVGGSVLLLGLLVGQSLTGVAKTALYVYATGGDTPEHFEDMDFDRLGDDSGGGTHTARI